MAAISRKGFTAMSAALLALVVVLFSCSDTDDGNSSGTSYAPATTDTYTLTVSSSPTSGGTVSCSPTKTAYAAGDTVTVIAVAAAGYQFASWTGSATTKDTAKIVMDGNKTLTANFDLIVPSSPNTYTITVVSIPANGGTVSRSPAKTAYAAGETVTLTAAAAPGFSFSSWLFCDEMLGSNIYTFVDIRMGNRDAVVEVEFIPMVIPPATITIDMVSVQGGTFTMGCTADQGDGCYKPEGAPSTQTVTLSNYQIGKYEITQKQWKTVMEGTQYYYPPEVVGDSLPQVGISWDVAVNQFLPRLNAMTGKNYRLPTEAEWEYAARGGTGSKGYKYSGSNTIDDVAWYADNSNRSYHQ